MANFETFCWNISSSINLFFVKSDHQRSKNIITAEEGEVLILNCTAETQYESCTFKHNSHICDFKYDVTSNDQQHRIKKFCSSMLDVNDRIKFVGSYEIKTCDIEIYLMLQDEGHWSCSTKLFGEEKTTSKEWFLKVNQNSKG